MKTSPFYTSEQLDYIRELRQTLTCRQITAHYNQRYGTNKNPKAIGAVCKRYRWTSSICGKFKKGDKTWNKDSKGLTSANKASFKPGQKPLNWLPDGSERFTSDGYRMIKTAEPSTWRLKHKHVWEAVHGPLPEKHILSFIDGDRSNCDPDNLELLSMSEHLLRNRYRLATAPEELQPLIKMLAKVRAKVAGLQRT